MIIMWIGNSYACSNTPDDIPRWLVIEDALESAGQQNWYVLDNLDHFSRNYQRHTDPHSPHDMLFLPLVSTLAV